jgi:hypothetical protein
LKGKARIGGKGCEDDGTDEATGRNHAHNLSDRTQAGQAMLRADVTHRPMIPILPQVPPRRGRNRPSDGP